MALIPPPRLSLRPGIHRRLFALLIAISSATGLRAASGPGAAALQLEGERQLEEGRTTLDAATLNAARNSLAGCARQDPRNDQCAFELARAEFYLVKAEDIAKHTDAARQMLDNAIGDVQKALAANDRSANAHALLADLYGAKITGMMSGMKYGPKASAETQRALQLDPSNPLAYAVQGRKYLFSPSAFGGDIDKAIESFKRAVALDPHSDEDYVWLAKAWKKKGDSVQMQQALKQALEVNGRSAFALRVQFGKE